MPEQLTFAAALDRAVLGRVAHEAYRAWVALGHRPRNYQDTTWEDLPESTREAYRVTASAVANAVRERVDRVAPADTGTLST